LVGVGYAWIIFAGFSIVPLSVLAQKHGFYEFYDPSFFSEEVKEEASSTNPSNHES
jgi:hypothetical protein